MKKNYSIIFLVVIVVLALGVRLYRINNPIADWHSWRQADTSAVSRNFIKFGFTPAVPRFDDVSNIASGRDNPLGYRMVEFPLYNSLSYFLYQILAPLSFSIEFAGRLVSIICSIISIIFLYLLTKSYANKLTALLSIGIAAVLPFYVYYSRSILPESFMIMCVLISLYILQRAVVSRKTVWFLVGLLLSSLFACCSLLIKPAAGFLLFPVFYIILVSKKPLIHRIGTLLLFGLLSTIPFIVWRVWILQFSEGVPAWEWLLNGDGIRFKGAFFYWILGERYSKLILGYFGVVFLIPGLLYKKGFKKPYFFYLWLLGMFLYLCTFATGNVKHDYYQVLTIPVIVVFVANGIYFFIENAGLFIHKYLTYTAIVLISILSLAFSYYHVRGYYWINNSVIVEAGKKADAILPSNAKVIAPYGGDTAFLYQTNRQGWPIGFDVSDKIKKGANYYISVSPKDPEVLELKAIYQIIHETDEFIILKLQ